MPAAAASQNREARRRQRKPSAGAVQAAALAHLPMTLQTGTVHSIRCCADIGLAELQSIVQQQECFSLQRRRSLCLTETVLLCALHRQGVASSPSVWPPLSCQAKPQAAQPGSALLLQSGPYVSKYESAQRNPHDVLTIHANGHVARVSIKLLHADAHRGPHCIAA